MTNGHGHDKNPQGNHPEAGFELQDLGSTAVYAFFVAIVVGAALVALVLRGTLYFAQHYASEHQATLASPLLPPKGESGEVLPSEVAQFPQPRLETSERTEIHDFRLKEEQQLHSYGWVDQASGIMHIPIDRAMELIAQRGLPTAPATGSAAPSIVNTVNAAAAASDHSDTSLQDQSRPAESSRPRQKAKGNQ
jgi:hypothetical protein